MSSLRRLLTSTAPASVILIRIAVGGVFLSEGIQKFLFPNDLGAGRYSCRRAILVSAPSRTRGRVGGFFKGQRLSKSILDICSGRITDCRRVCRFFIDRISLSESRNHVADNDSSVLRRGNGSGRIDEPGVCTSLRLHRLPNSHLCVFSRFTFCSLSFPGPVLA